MKQAIHSALAQGALIEVLIVDDGSSDGTAEMVRREFPSVRLERSEISVGCIVQRNRAAQLATGDIILSIDDDAIFASPHTVSQTLREFDHPRVGAVAIPYVEPRKSPVVHQQAPLRNGVFVTDNFIGTAHALVKGLFLRLGGYREFLVHQGEEMDYCIRMLEAGYVVRLGNADPIHHMESPRRDFRRMDYYGRRNDILFAWHNVPMPELLGHLPINVVNGLRSAARARRFRHMIWGTLTGLGHALCHPRNRRPVSRQVYWLFRHLRKRGPLRLADVAAVQAEAGTPKAEELTRPAATADREMVRPCK
ncbi:MAG: glycosyltransferase family 2 protein [Acidobacteria bacterium]|nr:glycosyltransferase family 2 protein [Acidobacteriota bacterium]